MLRPRQRGLPLPKRQDAAAAPTPGGACRCCQPSSSPGATCHSRLPASNFHAVAAERPPMPADVESRLGCFPPLADAAAVPASHAAHYATPPPPTLLLIQCRFRDVSPIAIVSPLTSGRYADTPPLVTARHNSRQLRARLRYIFRCRHTFSPVCLPMPSR